jgi:hypothetical protein
MRHVSFALFALVACGPHPWVPALEAMKADRVYIEISTESQDFNKMAPATVAPSVDNKWLLFFYDPKADPKMEEEFATRLSRDCFFVSVKRAADADDPDVKSEHAAACVFERVPPVPQKDSEAGTTTAPPSSQ